jgi:hypothetical protein
MSALAGPAAAETLRIASEYSISYSGITVARSKFSTSIDGEELSVKGSLSSAGLASVFTSITAESRSIGRITADGVQSTSFELNYASGKRQRKTSIAFNGGAVTDYSVTPPPRRSPEHIPLGPDDLNDVVDPFFASFVHATTAGEVCARTIGVFDGTTRSNLKLRASGVEPFKIGGRMIEGVRCAVRYQPVSGHRKTSASINLMADGERATILFAPIEGTLLYAPVKATIKVKGGTVSIRLTRMEATRN